MKKYKAEFYKGNELKSTVPFLNTYDEISAKVTAERIMYIYRKLYGCDNIKIVEDKG